MDVKIASLPAANIDDIKRLERKLGDGVCLLAVEPTGALYVLEAKMAPNVWERVDRAYPELEELKPYYRDPQDAHVAKSSLKMLFNGRMNHHMTKRPIRLRKIG